MTAIDLTADEQNAIRSLQRLAERWPSTLWLFAANGRLHVMRRGSRGEHVTTQDGGMDADYVVDTVSIDSDGGDW